MLKVAIIFIECVIYDYHHNKKDKRKSMKKGLSILHSHTFRLFITQYNFKRKRIWFSN